MIELSWYEFEGKKKKLPNNLIYRKSGALDLRFKLNKEFLADKRWKYRNPVIEVYTPVIAECLNRSTLLEKLKSAKTIRFAKGTPSKEGTE